MFNVENECRLIHEMYYNLYIILWTLVSYLYKLYTNYDKALDDVMHDVFEVLDDVMYDVIERYLYKLNTTMSRWHARWHANDMV